MTEREAIRDPDRLRTVLLGIQDAGVKLAADDVGAGNAGLRLLSQFRFDVVKIDLSLVQRGDQRPGPVDPALDRRGGGADGCPHDCRGDRDVRPAPDGPPARHHRRPGLPARPARARSATSRGWTSRRSRTARTWASRSHPTRRPHRRRAAWPRAWPRPATRTPLSSSSSPRRTRAVPLASVRRRSMTFLKAITQGPEP